PSCFSPFPYTTLFRSQFRYSFLAIKAVGISAIMATLMLQNMKGQGAVITLPHYDAPALKALWLFLFMGAIFGVLGFVFNKLVLRSEEHTSELQSRENL